MWLITVLWLITTAVCGQSVTVYGTGRTAQLWYDDKPYIILGGELGNSSATCADDIERVFAKAQRQGLNTVLVPAYWDLLEPTEGEYDFTLTEAALRIAREHELHIVFLWFGAWKNSMSCYAPVWVKQDWHRFPRAMTEQGKPLEIVSVFSAALLEADSRAYRAWLEHIAEMDRDYGTVLMVQIENEIGMLESARDHSAKAEEAYRNPVPEPLMSYLQRHKNELHPWLQDKWTSAGGRVTGTWQDVFGNDIYTDEIFMAWYYANYVEQLAELTRDIYPVPVYVNAAMNSRGRVPGEYPSAGPLAHLIDVWHAGAPSLLCLAPDLYDSDFPQWVAQYALWNNPLFIPEVQRNDNSGVRALYVVGEYHALGFSPFSIEDGSDAPEAPLYRAYNLLRELMPIISDEHYWGTMHGLLFDQEHSERVITEEEMTITCRHYLTLPWDSRATDGSTWPEGGAILIRLDRDAYLLAGSGIVVDFAMTTEKSLAEHSATLGEDGFLLADGTPPTATDSGSTFVGRRKGIASVAEVTVSDDGHLTPVRYLNGDQTHQGRHVRISIDDYTLLYIQLYEYQ